MRLFSLLTALLFVISALVGCSPQAAPTTPAGDPSTSAEAPKDSTPSTNAGTAGEVVKIRFCPTSASMPPIWREPIDYLIAKVEEYSNGTLVIEEMPGASLGGSERELVESLQQGFCDLLHITDANMGGVLPEIGWAMMPGLFDSYDEIDEIYRHGWIHDELAKQYAAKGMIRLATGDNGIRQLATTKVERPVETLADLNGLKIRVPDLPLLVTLWTKMGAMPVVISSGEQVAALQQGMADAVDNNIFGYPLNNVYEFTKTCTLTNHVYTGSSWIMYPETWNALSAEHQEVMKKAAVEAGDLLFSLVQAEEQEMIASGAMVMHEPDEAFKARLRDVGREMVEEGRASFGDELTDKIIAHLNSKG